MTNYAELFWKNFWAEKGASVDNILRKNDWIYVPIPKNACTYTGQVLMANNWRSEPREQNLQKKRNFLIILRDPIDRWVSGMTEYLHGLFCHSHSVDEIMNAFDSTVFRGLILDNMTFDDHTELQTYYLADIPLTESISYVYLDKNLTNKINRLFKFYNVPFHNFEIEQKNISTETVKRDLYLKLTEFVKKNKNYSFDYAIKHKFKEDYKLINSVKFYA